LFRLSGAEVLRRNSGRIGGFEKGEFERDSARKQVAAQIFVPRADTDMTGLSLAIEEQFSGKWLELLKEAAPQVSRVAYLWNPANHSSASSWKAMQGLAPRVGLTLQSVELRDPKDIDAALAAIIRGRAEGVIVDSDAIMAANQADRRVRSRKPPAANLHLQRIYGFRWPDVVRAELSRAVAAGGHLRR
jgi:hypothetical protein